MKVKMYFVNIFFGLMIACLTSKFQGNKVESTEYYSTKSPYYQHLPECGRSLHRIEKKTSARGMICPLVKDEQGFMSEWVAYYELHGFNHIAIYDDNSTFGFEELIPWINTGFVTIKQANDLLHRQGLEVIKQLNKFDEYYAVKRTDFLNSLASKNM